MDAREDDREEILGRLIRAAAGPGARPDPDARRRMLRRLESEMRVAPAPREFPDGILAFLVGFILILAARVGLRLAAGSALRADPALWAPACAVAANLCFLPVAILVIVLRRRHV
ncbi:MAG: hypothetical protein JXP34_24105 [Planctomycetes bacterium]|nr:hypothetical protein [Planctomycetota bacterium]